MKVKSKMGDPKGRMLCELVKLAFKLWDANLIRAREYDVILSVALERAPQLVKEGKIGRYYAKRIDEIHSVNQYLVHDIAELDDLDLSSSR